MRLVLADAFSSKYRHVTHKKKTFDRAVNRYRQGQEKLTDTSEKRELPLSKILQANFAKVSSEQPARPVSTTPQSGLTLAEANECLRARMEPLPAMVLKEVHKLREHTRYFFIASGRADALSLPADPQVKGVVSFPQENTVPEGLKKLLDEIGQEEGFDERLKQEVWDDEHARNVSHSLRQQKGCSAVTMSDALCT